MAGRLVNQPVLHIAGCGRTARVIARCLRVAGRVRVGEVANRSVESAKRAVDFIGEGRAAAGPIHPRDGDWLLIGTPDGAIGEAVRSLAAAGGHPPELAFHLSGAVGSGVLRPLGCAAASVHPLRAFADPDQAAEAFPGTWCVMEGDEKALARLEPVFAAAHARTMRLGQGDKCLYHAATVAASNFLVTLNDFATVLAGDAGLDPARSRELLCDLQAGTLDNIRALGAESALTGPIERGDVAACRALLEALPEDRRPLFRALGEATVRLARRRDPGNAKWDRLEKLFSGTHP